MFLRLLCTFRLEDFTKNNFQRKVRDNLEKRNQLEDSIQAENSQHRRVQEADFKMSNTTDK